MALNTEWECGFERQMKMWTWMSPEDEALDAERSETWLWMLKRMICNGSELRIEVDKGSESQTKQNMALDVETNDMQWLWTPNQSGQGLWKPNEAKHGSERRNEWCNGSERRTRIRLWMSNWGVIMALNAETENTTRIALNTDTDEWWLWTPNEDAMMALNTETRKATLNVKLGNDGGSARRNWECDEDSSEHWYWWVMALNAKRRCDDDSERRTKMRWWLWTLKPRNVTMMALNAKTENVTLNVELKTRWRLWTSKLRNDGGSDDSECRKSRMNGGSERQYWEMINGFESQNETTTPSDAEMKRWLWTPNQKNHRWMPIWNKSSACPTKLVTRNVMLRKTTQNIVNEKTRWLWMPSWKRIMALNTKTREMALNAETENANRNVKLASDDSSDRWNRETRWW